MIYIYIYVNTLYYDHSSAEIPAPRGRMKLQRGPLAEDAASGNDNMRIKRCPAWMLWGDFQSRYRAIRKLYCIGVVFGGRLPKHLKAGGVIKPTW